MALSSEKAIEYNLSRTSRKNVNITVKNDGYIYVSAPKKVTLTDINKIVLSKKDWILNAQKNIKSKKVIKNTISFRNNSSIYIYGECKKLLVVPAKRSSIFVQDDYIIFYVKEEQIDNLKYKNDTFNRLLKADLKKNILKYFDKYLTLLGLDVKELEIRIMKSRWGTCIPAKKKILLNFNLVHCPKASVEYVVLHEIVHLIHPNHSKAFYNTIETYMPDWKARKDVLQEFVIQ